MSDGDFDRELLLPAWLRDRPKPESPVSVSTSDADRHAAGVTATTKWYEPPIRPAGKIDPDTLLISVRLPAWIIESSSPESELGDARNSAQPEIGDSATTTTRSPHSAVSQIQIAEHQSGTPPPSDTTTLSASQLSVRATPKNESNEHEAIADFSTVWLLLLAALILALLAGATWVTLF